MRLEFFINKTGNEEEENIIWRNMKKQIKKEPNKTTVTTPKSNSANKNYILDFDSIKPWFDDVLLGLCLTQSTISEK